MLPLLVFFIEEVDALLFSKVKFTTNSLIVKNFFLKRNLNKRAKLRFYPLFRNKFADLKDRQEQGNDNPADNNA